MALRLHLEGHFCSLSDRLCWKSMKPKRITYLIHIRNRPLVESAFNVASRVTSQLPDLNAPQVELWH